MNRKRRPQPSRNMRPAAQKGTQETLFAEGGRGVGEEGNNASDTPRNAIKGLFPCFLSEREGIDVSVLRRGSGV